MYFLRSDIRCPRDIDIENLVNVRFHRWRQQGTVEIRAKQYKNFEVDFKVKLTMKSAIGRKHSLRFIN